MSADKCMNKQQFGAVDVQGAHHASATSPHAYVDSSGRSAGWNVQASAARKSPVKADYKGRHAA